MSHWIPTISQQCEQEKKRKKNYIHHRKQWKNKSFNPQPPSVIHPQWRISFDEIEIRFFIHHTLGTNKKKCFNSKEEEEEEEEEQKNQPQQLKSDKRCDYSTGMGCYGH